MRKLRIILPIALASVLAVVAYVVFFTEIEGVVDQFVPPMAEADLVEVRRTGVSEPFLEITSRSRIEELRKFINSYPAGWTVPFTGPPVGELYFDFYYEGNYVGNFYYGPEFFGRDHDGFFSRSVTDEEVRELTAILETAFLE